MHLQNLDANLQTRVQSKEFEHRVNRAVQSFLYDLDFMMLEEQHNGTRTRFNFERPVTTADWLIPA
jgi:hypothetical protein